MATQSCKCPHHASQVAGLAPLATVVVRPLNPDLWFLAKQNSHVVPKLEREDPCLVFSSKPQK